MQLSDITASRDSKPRQQAILYHEFLSLVPAKTDTREDILMFNRMKMLAR